MQNALKSFFLASFIFSCIPALSQKKQPYSGPFQKGKFITGINGSIRSGERTRTSANTTQESKEYDFTLGTKSGVFIRNRWLLGGSLNVAKSKSENQSLQLSEETFTIGPWTRFYTGRDNKGSLFFESNIFFARDNIDTRTTATINQQLTGNGFGGAIGVGFTYVVNPNIGFDLTLSYNIIQFYARDHNLIDNTANNLSFNENFITVSFGFQIMLNEFFF